MLHLSTWLLDDRPDDGCERALPNLGDFRERERNFKHTIAEIHWRFVKYAPTEPISSPNCAHIISQPLTLPKRFLPFVVIEADINYSAHMFFR
jgi:hypothetical protein